MVDVPSLAAEPTEAERLRCTGFAQFVLPPSSMVAVDRLHDIFKCFDTRGLFYLANDSLLTVPAGHSEPYSFGVIRADANPRMRWLWAHDAHTLDVFGHVLTPEVRARLSRASGGPIHLNAAHFIVSAGSILDEQSISHYDFFSPGIRRSCAFSLITPMSAGHPEIVGGLEFWPWTGIEHKSRTSGSAYRHDIKESCKLIAPYHHGFASVVDGKMLHRTQPYDLSVTAESAFSEFKTNGISTAGIAEAISSGVLRVLICIIVSTMDEQSYAEYASKLHGQAGTGHVRQNDHFELRERETDAEDDESDDDDDDDDAAEEDKDSDECVSDESTSSSSFASSQVATQDVLVGADDVGHIF